MPRRSQGERSTATRVARKMRLFLTGSPEPPHPPAHWNPTFFRNAHVKAGVVLILAVLCVVGIILEATGHTILHVGAIKAYVCLSVLTVCFTFFGLVSILGARKFRKQTQGDAADDDDTQTS